MAVLDTFNAGIPRYLLEHYHGPAAVGYFSALAYLMMSGGVVVSALGNSSSTRLARAYLSDFPAYRRLTLRLVAIAAVTGLAGVAVALVAGRPLLALLYRPDYSAYHRAFVWIMASAALWYVATFLYFSASAARRFRAQAPLLLATAAVTAVASAWLVPRFGVEGASWAFCLGMATRCLGAIAIMAAVGRGAGAAHAPDLGPTLGDIRRESAGHESDPDEGPS